MLNNGAGVCVGKGGQAVLQNFKFEGALGTNHIGPCGQKLTEFDIARAKPGEGCCQIIMLSAR